MNSPYLGLDIGIRRTGVALSESGLLTRPLTVIENQPPHYQRAIKEICELVRKHEIQSIVVGLPLQESGELTAQASKFNLLIERLREELKREKLSPKLITVNEYASTQEVAAAGPESSDADAAALILQQYLDSQEAIDITL